MSFYTSLNGLRNAQTDLEVISNNIANAETSGFKRQRADFADIVTGSAFTNPKQGIGATVEGVTQIFALGPIEQTGSALDLAINGDGFFSTRQESSGQTYFTRNGSFQLSGEGYVADSDGNRLQILPTDPDGTVTGTVPFDAQVPTASGTGSVLAGTQINEQGQLFANFADGSSALVGTVALARFTSVNGLVQAGSSNWEASGNSGPADYGFPSDGSFGSLLPGAIERSNVDLAEEMVSLITAQRNFQANARAIDTATTISQTVINLQS